MTGGASWPRRARALAVLCACVAGATFAQVDDFEARYAQAQRNEAESGYDEPLGRYFEAQPEVRERLNGCMAMPATQRASLHGYFEFDATGGYALVLRPAGAFADCVAAAFAGFAPPPPPQRPYVHGFTYTVQADR